MINLYILYHIISEQVLLIENSINFMFIISVSRASKSVHVYTDFKILMFLNFTVKMIPSTRECWSISFTKRNYLNFTLILCFLYTYKGEHLFRDFKTKHFHSSTREFWREIYKEEIAKFYVYFSSLHA